MHDNIHDLTHLVLFLLIFPPSPLRQFHLQLHFFDVLIVCDCFNEEYS